MKNVLRIVGHLGKDAETRTLTSGANVLNFSVASTETWKDKNGEKKQQTTWVNCSKFFGEKESQAISAYLKKGTHVMVEGKASARGYLNAKGEAEATLELRITDILLLDSKKEEGQQQQAPAAQPETKPEPVQNQVADSSSDDLPF